MSRTNRSRVVTVLLVLLPVWLLASGAGALWYYFQREKKQELAGQERFAQAVSIPMIADDLRKIVEVIGERNTASEPARANLLRTASMIEGILGPSNTGYTVRKTTGPAEWPLLEVSLPGKSADAGDVWVVTTYDSPVGSRGTEENASGLAATLAAAQALANDKPAATVHFAFLPHGNEHGPLAADAVGKLTAQFAENPRALLCVGPMGLGDALWLSTATETALPTSLADGLGKIYAPSAANPASVPDLTARFETLSLTPVRVATGPLRATVTDENRTPFAPTVAASAGRLIELIRRCAEK